MIYLSVTLSVLDLSNAYSTRVSATTTPPPPEIHVAMLTSCYMYKITTF
jgi:hypothetical protein